ncbi:MAG TPA: PTS fructose transporter subunit IIA [Terrisporobacter glycolicus]|uniref:PTS sugar transporter subunit IIA n=1 Tax=Terrisporobacter TaxID=1505652 RepID=UPI000E95C7F3|nr:MULTISPECIES: fructose PTS transporter subunit IIA [Terrisporobacter]HBI93256.1 PTS fructose transporter subunit IIA [Terrisporobacter hibernicus]
MELLEILDEHVIKDCLQATNKIDAITKMCTLLHDNGYISNIESFKSDVLKREKLGETGIGNMIAIPHGKSSSVEKSAISICKLDREIDWETLDGKGVKVIILFGVQDDVEAAKDHLKLLAEVARKLAKEEVVESLVNAKSSKDIIDCFR